MTSLSFDSAEEIRRPDCFGHIEGMDYQYFVFRDHDETVFYMAARAVGPVAELHTEVVKWTPGSARFMTRVFFNDIEPHFRRLGIHKLVAAKAGIKDKNWEKFLKMFGFSKPVNLLYTEKRI